MHDTERRLAGIADRTLADLGSDAFEAPARPSRSPDMTTVEKKDPATKRVTGDVRAPPWCWVCSVDSLFNEEYWTLDNQEKREFDDFDPLGRLRRLRASGSGIVISPRHVLTAGHNVYGWSGHYEHNDTKTEFVQAKAIKVVPARRPFRNRALPQTLSGPYGVWKVAQVHHHDRLFSYRQLSKNFYQDMDNPSSGLRQHMAHDFVLLEIEPKGIGKGRRHMGEQTPKGSSTPLGWWCRSSENAIRITDTEIDRQDLSHRSVNVAGYPEDRSDRTVDRMYRGFHHVRHARGNIVEHRVEARRGTSGGPIWTFNSNQAPSRQLVGMHTMSGNSDTNYAQRLLDPMGLVIHRDLAAFLKEHVPAKYLRFV